MRAARSAAVILATALFTVCTAQTAKPPLRPVGDDPDVLAFDRGLNRLYVSAESGIISVFDERGRNLEKIGEGFFAPQAHTIAVDSRTHRIYLPLESVGGKPALRIALPSDMP